MEKIVPFEISYNNIRNLEKWAWGFLILSSIAIILLWFFPKNSILEIISMVCMVAYLATSLLVKFFFKEAEKKKREDLIDNSFQTSFSDYKTKNYYNNEKIPPGIIKLTFNAYESSFHTQNTLKFMVKKKFYQCLFFTVLFFISALTEGGHELFRILVKISIPIILITNFLVTLEFLREVKYLNEKFKGELSNLESNHILELKDHSRFLIPVIEYYTIKAWANINLDSEVFNTHNTKLSEKWEERKRKLGF